jgi:hypothetical protein
MSLYGLHLVGFELPQAGPLPYFALMIDGALSLSSCVLSFVLIVKYVSTVLLRSLLATFCPDSHVFPIQAGYRRA